MEVFQVIEAVRHSPVISRRCRRATTGSAGPALDDVSFTVGLPTLFAVRHSAAAREPLVTDGAIVEDRTAGLC